MQELRSELQLKLRYKDEPAVCQAWQAQGFCRALINERADGRILPAMMTLVEGATTTPLRARLQCAASIVQLPGHDDDGLHQRAGTFLERPGAGQ